MFTGTARKRGSDQMTVVKLDTNRAAVNVSDGAGHRDILFFHFASAVASTKPLTPDQSVVTSRKKQSGTMERSWTPALSRPQQPGARLCKLGL
jgi:hypothetical protein